MSRPSPTSMTGSPSQRSPTSRAISTISTRLRLSRKSRLTTRMPTKTSTIPPARSITCPKRRRFGSRSSRGGTISGTMTARRRRRRGAQATLIASTTTPAISSRLTPRVGSARWTPLPRWSSRTPGAWSATAWTSTRLTSHSTGPSGPGRSSPRRCLGCLARSSSTTAALLSSPLGL